jgi:hypothetical protein
MATKTVRVKCDKCGHQAELMGDERTTWLCNCAAGVGPDDCRCDHLNVVEAD